ncbi:MAG: hypothetical protein J7647_15585 [Cyanobacteria bacterium SBLK]|nr:hypothetical protein [Cyanobacteria bacterium SBLK]
MVIYTEGSRSVGYWLSVIYTGFGRLSSREAEMLAIGYWFSLLGEDRGGLLLIINGKRTTNNQ